MVVAAAFMRSLSLPLIKKPKKASQVRSASLPGRSLTNLALVKDKMRRAQEWIAAGRRNRPWNTTVENLLTGLRLLRSLYDAVDDFVHFPQTRYVINRNEKWVDLFLDDLLKFLDVFGALGTVLSSLKEYHLSTLMVSLRRREPNGVKTDVQTFINQRKRANREMRKLRAILKSMERTQTLANYSLPQEEMEVVSVFDEVKAMTVSVAVAVVSGVCRRQARRMLVEKWVGLPKRRVDCIKEMKDADCAMDSVSRSQGRIDLETAKMILKSMAALEDSLNGLELGSDSMFRSLINTRVCILNILTLSTS